MAFDPTQFGALPAKPGSFDPTKLGATPVAPAAKAGGGFIHSIADQFHSGIDQIQKGASEIAHGENPLAGAESGLRVESGIASAITSPLAPLFYPVKAAVTAVADKVGDNPAVQKFAQSPAGKTTARVAEDLSNAGNVAGTIASVAKAPDAIQAAKTGIQKLPDAIAEQAATSSDKPIVDAFYKAVKPTMAGKTGPGQLDAYNNSVASAVKTIASNRDKLSFDDGAGTVVQGELPTTRAELADAVEQSKQAVFNQYNELTKQATGQGVKISLEPASQALQDVVENDALQLSHPEAVSYAKSVQQRFQNPDGSFKEVDPQTVEQVVSNYNADLKAFYRNPSYGTASRAAIDAGVVHQLRQSLGDAIENATGENYTGLKRSYGALATIERDVNKAALAQLKQTGTIPSGIGKYVDIFSGGDMVSGLMSLNPALFAKGVAQSAITHLWQHLNSPDRAVVNMFSATGSPK